MGTTGALSFSPATASPQVAAGWLSADDVEAWRSNARRVAWGDVADFIAARRAGELDDARVDAMRAERAVRQFADLTNESPFAPHWPKSPPAAQIAPMNSTDRGAC